MMGVIPQRDETVIRLYRCGGCHKVYSAQVGLARISCCAIHAPGECCHFYEKEVTPEMLRTVRELLACEGENPVVDWGPANDLYAVTSTVSDGLESSEVTLGSP